MNLYIDGYNLVLGSFACPETYDVFDPKGNQVAHFRLRHGKFAVYCPDYNTWPVYSVSVNGDGSFFPAERIDHLKLGIKATQKWIIEQNMKAFHEE